MTVEFTDLGHPNKVEPLTTIAVLNTTVSSRIAAGLLDGRVSSTTVIVAGAKYLSPEAALGDERVIDLILTLLENPMLCQFVVLTE